VLKLTFLLMITLFYLVPAMAQSSSATITGLVLDPSGAAIVGADVVVVNDATGIQYLTKTNSEGVYVVTNLPPGPYRIQVSNTGFKTIIKPDIVIHVQDALAINFTLPLGAASEVVTVQGGAPLINTENASVSTVIDRNFVENLPLNGRSFNTLLQMTPGVVITPVGSGLGQFSIAGQRTDANSFTVDGVSANFGVVNGPAPRETGSGSVPAFSALGGTSSLVSVEALQEFRIETSSFAPEFGRAPGGQVILTTRSGTNELHGGLYEYFRNEILDANDWFANAAGKARAPERHNDFGGFLGGPILKDNTFYFLSYEGARLRVPKAQAIQVPSEWARSVAAPPTLAPFLAAYPQPDDRTIMPNVYTSRFTGVWSDSATLNAGSLRLDQTFSSRLSIFGRYNDAPSDLTNRFFSLSTLSPMTVNTKTFTAGADAILTDRLSDTFRGNYSILYASNTSSLDSFGGAVPLPLNLLLGSLSAQDNQASLSIGDANLFQAGPTVRNATRQINFVDALSYSVGTHELKFGVDYRGIYLRSAAHQHTVRYSATSVQKFLASNGQASLSTSTAASAHVLSKSVSLFAQDSWKAAARTTLTYGVRWELSPAPEALGTTTLASWQNVENPSQIALAPPGTSLWQTKYGSFAPRVGIAFSLTKQQDLVLRAGAGIFYDLGVGSSVVGFFPNVVSGFTPQVQMPLSDPSSSLPALSLQPPFPNGLTVGFSPSLKLPRSYQWNIALEKSFGGGQVISMTYLGQAGRDLLRQEAITKPNANFSGDFLLTVNDARSNYNALQIQYRRPVSASLRALLNYAWSHSLDNASDDVVAGLSNTVISSANDYASSSFDVRQSFSGALTYAIPTVSARGLVTLLTKDWSVDAIVVARSGFPFNAFNFINSPDPNGNALVRPDRVPGQPYWIANPSAPGGKSLNPGAFSTPSIVRQGTEGRNDIPGFGLTEVDMSVARGFPVWERVHLQIRADAFNVFNHPNFTNPQGFFQFGATFLQSQKMLNQGLGGLNPLFQEGGPRSLQLALKITF
jgi:hypothetical protein